MDLFTAPRETEPADCRGIVVGHAVPEPMDGALDRGLVEASAHQQPLRVVSTWAPVATAMAASSALGGALLAEPLVDTEALTSRACRQDLRSALRRVRCGQPLTGPQEAEIEVRPGAPAQVLVEASQRSALLVVGADRRPPWRTALSGSTVHGLLRRSRTPVMVVPRQAVAGAFTRIVTRLDPHQPSVAALEWAAAEARVHHCPLEVVTVVPDRRGARARQAALPALDTFLDRQNSLSRCQRITSHVLSGHVAATLVAHACPTDLLVVPTGASSSRVGWRRLDRVVRQCAEQTRATLTVIPDEALR